MNAPTKKPFRKRHLFARSVSDVVKNATQPLMTKQGKLYGALLRDWPQIVGEPRAKHTRPDRLQFSQNEQQGAVLHIAAAAAFAPELAYETEQMLEQCARYFGYRAITRIVIHATHDGFAPREETLPQVIKKSSTPQAMPPLSDAIPSDIRDILQRISTHVTSASDKK